MKQKSFVKLAKKARKFVDKMPYSIDDRENEYIWKLSELIVRQCIVCVRNESMNSDKGWENGLVFAECAIKEHFGIEE